MKKPRIKIVLVLLVVIFAIMIVKSNVTAIKNTRAPKELSNSATMLEINSEVVQNTFSSLVLLQDSIRSNNYKNLYFEIENDKNKLSIEEKMYTIFESIYSKKSTALEEDEEELKITKDEFDNESVYLYGSIIDTSNSEYKIDNNCGITSYEYDNDIYNIVVKPCEDKRNFTKTKLVTAIKDENYIYLGIKAFNASTTSSKADDNKKVYNVRNFNSPKNILKTSYNEIIDTSDSIFENYGIDEYTFTFELKGDGYYLSRVDLDN